MKSKLNITKTLNRIADIVELIIAFIIIIAVLCLLGHTIAGLFTRQFLSGQFDFHELLSGLFNIIIGLEFTRMLCKHTPETIVEVLMFATARQMIVEHSGPLDTLLGVIAIGVLFAMRKFLQPGFSEDDGNIYIKNLRYAARKRRKKEELPEEDGSEA